MSDENKTTYADVNQLAQIIFNIIKDNYVTKDDFNKKISELSDKIDNSGGGN